MTAALAVARAVLALVLVIAAVAKLADRARFRETVANFGVPARAAGVVSIVLPLAELAIAVALVAATPPGWGALAALGLLSLFTISVGISLARHKEPNCRCFGRLHSGSLSWRTLLRNGALTGLAGFVVWQQGMHPDVDGLSGLPNLSDGALVALAIAVMVGVVALEGFLLFKLLRQQGRLLLRIETIEAQLHARTAEASKPGPPQGLPVGSQAPDVVLSDVFGETRSLPYSPAAGTAMLVFTDTGCRSCTALLPEVARWQRAHGLDLKIAVVCRGGVEAIHGAGVHEVVDNLFVDGDGAVARAYQISARPSAVVVSADGTVLSSLAVGHDAIRRLLGRTVATSVAALAGSPE